MWPLRVLLRKNRQRALLGDIAAHSAAHGAGRSLRSSAMPCFDHLTSLHLVLFAVLAL